MLKLLDFFPSIEGLDSFLLALPYNHAVIINQTKGWLQIWKADKVFPNGLMINKRLVKTYAQGETVK